MVSIDIGAKYVKQFGAFYILQLCYRAVAAACYGRFYDFVAFAASIDYNRHNMRNGV